MPSWKEALMVNKFKSSQVLSYESNPLLDALPPAVPYASIPSVLPHHPLKKVDVFSFASSERETILELIDEHFTPTSPLIEPFAGLQILLRRTLMIRNPSSEEEVIRMNKISTFKKSNQFKTIAGLKGGGMLISGMTGSGKSALVKRTLEILAPNQVMEYGPSKACGWIQLRQCVYLLIDYPSNGTRGALLKRILEALDDKLGTSYFEKAEKSVNIDSLLVSVCKLLALHRVAILVIDENQESNFSESPWFHEFTLFYLSLMNLGISIVLSGNPLAFINLKFSSQVMRRFSVGGIHELQPATVSEKWWLRDFVPGVRKFNVVENWQIDSEWRNNFERENSAGIPGVYIALHKEVMRRAIRRSEPEATVTQEDFIAALSSPRFKELNQVAKAISSNTVSSAKLFSDIPPTRQPVGTHDKPEATTTAIVRAPNESGHIQRMLVNFQKAQTRELTKLKKRIANIQELSPDDARMLGISSDHLSSMLETLESITSQQSSGTRNKRGTK